MLASSTTPCETAHQRHLVYAAGNNAAGQSKSGVHQSWRSVFHQSPSSRAGRKCRWIRNRQLCFGNDLHSTVANSIQFDRTEAHRAEAVNQ